MCFLDQGFGRGFSSLAAVGAPTADDINPALAIIRNVPQFPEFRVLKVMQHFYHQRWWNYNTGFRV